MLRRKAQTLVTGRDICCKAQGLQHKGKKCPEGSLQTCAGSVQHFFVFIVPVPESKSSQNGDIVFCFVFFQHQVSMDTLTMWHARVTHTSAAADGCTQIQRLQRLQSHTRTIN